LDLQLATCDLRLEGEVEGSQPTVCVNLNLKLAVSVISLSQVGNQSLIFVLSFLRSFVPSS